MGEGTIVAPADASFIATASVRLSGGVIHLPAGTFQFIPYSHWLQAIASADCAPALSSRYAVCISTR